MRRAGWTAILTATVLSLLSSTAPPALAAPQDVANDIAGQIMSPFCDGVTLHDCPSQAALDLRARIADWAAAGWTRARIMERLEDEYGPSIRATPPTEGGGIVAWLLPAFALACGAATATFLARRWTRRRAEVPSTQISAEERERVELELRTFREAQ